MSVQQTVRQHDITIIALFSKLVLPSRFVQSDNYCQFGMLPSSTMSKLTSVNGNAGNSALYVIRRLMTYGRNKPFFDVLSHIAT